MAKIIRVNTEKHGKKVETVRYSRVNLVGQDSTKSVYITILRLLQSTVIFTLYLYYTIYVHVLYLYTIHMYYL